MKLSLVLRIVIITGMVYVVYALLVFFMQRVLIYPGKGLVANGIPEYLSSNIEPLWLESNGGKVEAWFVSSDSIPQKPVIIFAHGNYELIEFCLGEARAFNKLGFDVLLIEFPAYGNSSGELSQESITRSFINGYDWLVESKKTDPEKIFGFGRSLGGGVICALGKERRLAGVILQSTFTRIADFAGKMLLPAIMVRDPYDNQDFVSRYKGPLLIFHGRYDDVIPYAQGVALSKLNPQAEFISYDCKHNDMPIDNAAHWQTIKSFFNRNFK